jgi:hypothetical protein
MAEKPDITTISHAVGVPHKRRCAEFDDTHADDAASRSRLLVCEYHITSSHQLTELCHRVTKPYVKACPKSKSRRKSSRKWRSSAASSSLSAPNSRNSRSPKCPTSGLKCGSATPLSSSSSHATGKVRLPLKGRLDREALLGWYEMRRLVIRTAMTHFDGAWWCGRKSRRTRNEVVEFAGRCVMRQSTIEGVGIATSYSDRVER